MYICMHVYMYLRVCIYVCTYLYSVTSVHELNSLLEAFRQPKLSVLSESYTATDALPPILPACSQPLLPACVFVTRDTVRHPRLFFYGKFVREPIC
jgi:hypothetical protein